MSLLGKLAVAVTGEIGELKAAFKETKKEANSLGGEVKKAGMGLEQVAKYGMLAGAAIVSALGLATIKTAAYAEQIDMAAQKTGMGVEQFQALAYAAKLQDMEMGTLSLNLVRMARSMESARDGTRETKEAFASLGVKVTEADGRLRKTDSVLLEMADKFSRMADGAEKSAAAMAIFGRSGADMIPFLNQGRERIAELMEQARKLGMVISAESITALAKFDDQIDAVKAGLAGFAMQLSADAVPYISSFVRGLQSAVQWVHSLPEPLRQAITTGTLFAGVLALVGGGLVTVITKIAAAKVALATLGTSFAAFATGGAIIAGLGLIVTQFIKMRENARLANLEIANTTNLLDLQAEQRRIVEQEEYINARLKVLKQQRDAIYDEAKRNKAPQSWIDYMLKTGAPGGGILAGIATLEKQLTDLGKRSEAAQKQVAKILSGGADAGGGDVKWSLSETLAKLKTDMDLVDKAAETLGDTTQVNADKANLLRTAITDLLRHGIDPTKTSLGNLVVQFKANEAAAQASTEEAKKAAEYWAAYDEAIRQHYLTEQQAREEARAANTAYWQAYDQAILDHYGVLREVQQGAENLLGDGMAYLAQMTGEAVPEWEAFARTLEDMAKKSILPDTAAALLLLADSIRKVGEAEKWAAENTFTLDPETETTWQGELAKLAAGYRDWGAQMVDIAETTAKSAEQMFSDFFFDAFTGQLKSLAEYITAFANAVARSVANMLGQQFTGFLMGQFFPGMATGGPVIGGMPYIVGERGPEMFVPATSGTIVPNDKLGAPDINVNLINQSGQPLKGKQAGPVKFDGRRYVVSMLLEADAANIGGIHDVLNGRR